MHPAFEALSKRLEARSPIDVDGTPFALHLLDIREADERTVDVIVEAHDDSEQYTDELHLRRERLDDLDYLEPRIIATMGHIIRGDLPPGARELI